MYIRRQKDLEIREDRESGGGQCRLSQPTGEEGLDPNKTTAKNSDHLLCIPFPD